MKKLILFFCVIHLNMNSIASKYLKEIKGDIAIGSETAPVTIIEYSSLTCPHCAEFHNNVLPEIEKKYIKPGKLRFIHRPTFHPQDIIAAKASMIPFCFKKKYHKFLKVIMKTQKNWLYETSKHLETIEDIAKLGGMDGEDFQQCIKNNEIENKILTSQLIATNSLQIDATPTFIINEKIYRGFLSKNAMNKIIDELLK